MDRKQKNAGAYTALIIAGIIAVCVVLFFVNLGVRDFWAPDEGDFAQIVTELATDPVVPHLNNTAYGEKPPLFYYIVFAFQKSFYHFKDETSMRLASATMALAVVIVFFVTCLVTFGLRRAATGAFILALIPLFYWQARYLQVDMRFSGFLCFSLFAFLLYARTGRKISYYIFFAALACAFMAKGPLAIALAVPIAVFYCFTEKKIPILLTRHTAAGIVLFLAIVIPWYSAVYIKEGLPYLYENILRQNFLRFFDAWSHNRPFYYYFTTLPLDFFPWSIFLPIALYTAFKRSGQDTATRFFLVWFVWIFFFLSLSSGKISKYMLPALPALAVLVSGAIEDRGLYNRVAYGIIGGLFCLLGIVLVFYKPSLYTELRIEGILIAIGGIVLGLLVLTAVRYKSTRSAFIFVALFLAFAYTVGNISIFEKFNRYKSPRPIGEKIRARIGDTIPWVYYGSMRGVYIYYVGKFAVHIEEHDVAALKEFAGKTREFYLLTRQRDAGEVEAVIPDATVDIQERIGGTSMTLFHYARRIDTFR